MVLSILALSYSLYAEVYIVYIVVHSAVYMLKFAPLIFKAAKPAVRSHIIELCICSNEVIGSQCLNYLM